MENFSEPASWQYAVLQGLVPLSGCAKLYRRKVLTPSMLDIPRRITSGEDALMNIHYAFAMKKPPVLCLSHVYNYNRNSISLSHTTKGSVDYEYYYDQFRLKAIPADKHDLSMNSITKFRINGVLGCCRSDTKTVASKKHPFFKIIRDGMLQCGYRLSFFEWIVMNIKSPYIIKCTGLIRTILISLRYKIHLLFRKR